MTAVPAVPNHIANDRFVTTGNQEDSLTALAGGGQTGATPITAQCTRFSVCATNADSGALPKIGPQAKGFDLGAVNSVVIVRNDGVAILQVYGQTPDTINGVATGTGVAVGAGKTAIFVAQSYVKATGVGNWIMVLSA